MFACFFAHFGVREWAPRSYVCDNPDNTDVIKKVKLKTFIIVKGMKFN